jgi:uncharacterized protein (TIGR00290 family)
MAALVSWSGGKDSCLAFWRAKQAGADIRLLITAMDESGERSRSHGVPPELLRAQAAALGLALEFYLTSWKTYEEKFIALLRSQAEQGITQAVFGDIDLVPHREWEEKVCSAAGLRAELPLWLEPRRKLVDEFLAAGFKAVVVCVNGNYLDQSFCGRDFDQQFLDDLPASVDACGENGEFHTFVVDGPAFAHAVPFQRGPIEAYTAPAEFGATPYFFQTLRGVRT